MSLDYGAILAGVFTLAIYSYLYRENPAYRLGENLLIALAMAHLIVISITTIHDTAITPLLGGESIWIVPIILGFVLYLYFVRTYSYLFRIPIAIMVGVGTALSIRGALSAQLFEQLIANISSSVLNVDNFIIVIGSVLVLYYFIFTFGERRSGLPSYVDKIARWVMMAGFGATFGNVVMGRISATTGRIQALVLTDAIYIIPVAAVIMIAYIAYGNLYRKPTAAAKSED